MSADFWAGYISGAAQIIVGNPLDIKKVQLQAARHPGSSPPLPSSLIARYFPTRTNFVAGVAAPILGSGFLNGILFAAYSQTEDFLGRSPLLNSTNITSPGTSSSGSPGSSLWTTWIAGAVGGIAVWVVSTPTELIKCRAQLASTARGHPHAPSSSWGITCAILRAEGIRGLYRGGAVTTLRDSIGYGFYFWTYELCGRIITTQAASASPNRVGGDNGNGNSTDLVREAAKVLFCGGVAGVVSWASVFPLDVIKTRVQAQATLDPIATPLLGTAKRKGALQIAREVYRQEGMRAFFRGLGVCSLRAFIVNAVQWGVYESVMSKLNQPNEDGQNEFLY